MAPFPLTRRQLLLAGAGGLVLAACGKGGGDTVADTHDDGGGSTRSSVPEVAGNIALYKLFAPEQAVGVPLRLPIAFADQEGSFDVELPPSIELTLRPPAGGHGAGPMRVARRSAGLPRGYFPVRAKLDVPGRWTIAVDTGKVKMETTVDAKPPSELAAVPGPGDTLPRVPTPTTADHRGVQPICTRDPVCPFHGKSLDQALGAGGPIALVVSTPAFCQVAICGPVLDLLVARKAQLDAAGIVTIHAEVYVDERATKTTPTVDALGLTYEPALFLASPDGTVTERLDYIWDRTELDEAIARLQP